MLRRLLPELGGDAVTLPVPAANVCALFVGVFHRFARRGPLLVVVEDLHWSDTVTQLLVATLSRPGRAVPLLLVGTYRSDELHPHHPWRAALAELLRAAHPERVSLAPLDRAETTAMIAAVGSLPAANGLVAEVHRRSGGNAYFVEELVAAAAEGASGVPESLRDAVLARASRLDGVSESILRALAVGGAGPPDVLGHVGGLGEQELSVAIDRLVATALVVVSDGEVRFRHELGREVFDEGLHPGERADLHARWADASECLRPDRLGEIARHWAGTGQCERALAAAVTAGREAMRSGAAGEAETHLSRALSLWERVGDAAALAGVDHPALLLETSIAARHANHGDVAVTLALSAETEVRGDDPMREARIWLHLRDVYRDQGRYEQCADAIDRALAVIPPDPPSAELAEALADACSPALLRRPRSGGHRLRPPSDGRRRGRGSRRCPRAGAHRPRRRPLDARPSARLGFRGADRGSVRTGHCAAGAHLVRVQLDGPRARPSRPHPGPLGTRRTRCSVRPRARDRRILRRHHGTVFDRLRR